MVGYELFAQYIRVELIVLVVVLYVIGAVIKNTHYIADELIPIILGVISIVLCGIYIFAVSKQPSNYQEVLSLVFDIIVQGVCCAAGSAYVNQIYKQNQKLKEKE